MKIVKTLLQSALIISAINICEVQASWDTFFTYSQDNLRIELTYVENQECGKILLIANEFMRNPKNLQDSSMFEWLYWRGTGLKYVHDVVLHEIINNLDTYPEGKIYWTDFSPDENSACASTSVYTYQNKIDWATKVNDSIWQTLIDEKIVKSRK
jgi:hypothetical protein